MLNDGEITMTMTTEQKAARLALIKQVAEKRKASAEFKRRQQINTAKVRRYTDVVDRPARKAKVAEFDGMIEKLNENHNEWTDAPQYAEKYYGQVYRDTTRYDNEWN
jgi:hypothetical protein